MVAAAIPYTRHLRADGDRIADLVAEGPLDAAVPGCPGWTLADLTVHVGWVHRWAQDAASTGAEPTLTGAVPPPEDAAGMAAWTRSGATDLADTLDGLDPAAPTWHHFPAERVVSVWSRRQAQETALHRWDAEGAIGSPRAIDPVLASDGIDEYFELMLPRIAGRDEVTLPEGSLHVHVTDTAGEWTVETTDGAPVVTREHRKGDAVLRGRAEDLLLSLWGRPVPEGAVDVLGDDGTAREWLALGGM